MAGDLEDLVMELSTELLGVRGEHLSATINDSLGRLSRVLGADRAYVLKASVEDRSVGEAFEEWWAAGIERVNTPIALLPRDAQRFWMRSLRAGDVVAASDVQQLADSCEPAATALQNDGVRSILFVPLLARSQPVGFIGFEGRHHSIEWAPRTVSRIRTVGELLVGSIERCYGDAERAEVALALESRNAELERSNRELQQFASVVSHDLSQPLVMVRGFLDALASVADEHPTRAEEGQRYAEAARRSTDRMRTLIEDVLSLARAGAPLVARNPVDLEALVEEVVDDLSAAVAEAGAEVTVSDLPVVEGGRTQLRQLFQNLIANALRYRHPDRPQRIAISCGDTGDGTVISVADNGIGIPEDKRRSVFEMFARAAASDGAGLGIGLAVCSRVAVNHGGRIWIEGNDAGGTTVRVSLPYEQPDRATMPA